MSTEINKQGNQNRHGFLPMDTNLFDRFFISVVIAVALHLLWMRWLEARIDLLVATAISVGIGALVVLKG